MVELKIIKMVSLHCQKCIAAILIYCSGNCYGLVHGTVPFLV